MLLLSTLGIAYLPAYFCEKVCCEIIRDSDSAQASGSERNPSQNQIVSGAQNIFKISDKQLKIRISFFPFFTLNTVKINDNTENLLERTDAVDYFIQILTAKIMILSINKEVP